MSLTHYCYMSLLLVSLAFVVSGNEYNGKASEPKYNKPEDQLIPNQSVPRLPFGNGGPGITSPRHFPLPVIRRPNPVTHQNPIPSPPPALYGPRPPRFRMPRQLPTPLHNRPSYKKPGRVIPPFNTPGNAPPLYRQPGQNTPFHSPPVNGVSPSPPPPPSANTTPANNPPPPPSY